MIYSETHTIVYALEFGKSKFDKARLGLTVIVTIWYKKKKKTYTYFKKNFNYNIINLN